MIVNINAGLKSALSADTINTFAIENSANQNTRQLTLADLSISEPSSGGLQGFGVVTPVALNTASADSMMQGLVAKNAGLENASLSLDNIKSSRVSLNSFTYAAPTVNISTLIENGYSNEALIDLGFKAMSAAGVLGNFNSAKNSWIGIWSAEGQKEYWTDVGNQIKGVIDDEIMSIDWSSYRGVIDSLDWSDLADLGIYGNGIKYSIGNIKVLSFNITNGLSQASSALNKNKNIDGIEKLFNPNKKNTFEIPNKLPSYPNNTSMVGLTMEDLRDWFIFVNYLLPVSEFKKKYDVKTELKLPSLTPGLNFEDTELGNAKVDSATLIKYFKEFYKARKSDAIAKMMISHADFLTHMFDVFFVVYSDNTNLDLFDYLQSRVNDVDGEDVYIGSNVKSAGLYKTLMAVRIRSIEIPEMETETWDLKFLNDVITKSKSRVEFDRKSTISVDLDERLYIIDLFNAISGNSIKQGGTNFGAVSGPKLFNTNLRDKSLRMDIFVKHRDFTKANRDLYYKNPTPSSSTRFETLSTIWNSREGELQAFIGMQDENEPCWVFEDVRFLGPNNELDFDRDQSEKVVMQYDFIFKRLYKIRLEDTYSGRYGEVGPDYMAHGIDVIPSLLNNL